MGSATPPSSWRLRLGTARAAFSRRVSSALSGDSIQEETWESLEHALLSADVGVDATHQLLGDLRAAASQSRVSDPSQLASLLTMAIASQLASDDGELDRSGSPAVWMFVGVNGSGKTTTIGKLAHAETAAGRKVVLAAGDTFRAAASEQLSVWAGRTGAGIVRGQPGGDPASVVYDAIEHARAQAADLVLIDTAGRLHSDRNLMSELAKIQRVAGKASGRLSEVLLVLDAAIGQNSFAQARDFGKYVDLTGAVLTKLDGSAKGGVVLSVRSVLNLPVKLLGLGEGLGDLVLFDADAFARGILD